MASSTSTQRKQTFRRFFIPTTTESYRKRDEMYQQAHFQTIQNCENELQRLRDVISHERDHRGMLLRELQFESFPDVSKDDEELKQHSRSPCRMPSHQKSFMSEAASTSRTVCEKPIAHSEAHVGDLYQSIKRSNLFNSFEVELKQSVEKYRYLVETQATADLTGYRELRDWAKDTLRMFDYLMTVMICISTVGATLVYATIFSASRGNIGYMCTTFPLFTVGFIIPVAVQISLRWASSFPKHVQFASQKFWKYVIIASMVFSVMAILTALILLNITIILLATGSAPKDTSFNMIPGISSNAIYIPGIAAMAFTVSLALVILGAFLLSVLAKGLKAVRASASRKKIVEGLENFRHI